MIFFMEKNYSPCSSSQDSVAETRSELVNVVNCSRTHPQGTTAYWRCNRYPFSAFHAFALPLRFSSSALIHECQNLTLLSSILQVRVFLLLLSIPRHWGPNRFKGDFTPFSIPPFPYWLERVKRKLAWTTQACSLGTPKHCIWGFEMKNE